MFKSIKYILSICCVVLLSTFLCACNSDSIKINGNFEETIEVNTKFNDLGISCSDKYNVITEGEVNTSTIGRYQLVYKVYSTDGEFVKELSRYVNVVDTTAPTYEENSSITYYAGYTYGIEDFITYTDNYDNKTNISTDFTQKQFTSPGNYLIKIKLKDSSNNEATFQKNVNVILDLDKLVHDVYQTQPSKISTSSPEGHGTSTQVTIDSTTSFSYWDAGSIHFIKRVQTQLGAYASIQISATRYGSFNNANIDYLISNNSEYSVGFSSIDATKKYTTLTINSFKSTVNNLGLNETEMLNECNENLLNVLNEFQTYMTNILHLDIK